MDDAVTATRAEEITETAGHVDVPEPESKKEKIHKKLIKLTDEELELLEDLSGGKGKYTQTLIDGLYCLQATRVEMTDEYLIFELRKRLFKRGKTD